VTREVLRGDRRASDGARGRAVIGPALWSGRSVEQNRRASGSSTSGLVAYVPDAIDPAWRVPGDAHPNAHAAHEMATAIVVRPDEATVKVRPIPWR
jgi:hypothetical protein